MQCLPIALHSHGAALCRSTTSAILRVLQLTSPHLTDRSFPSRPHTLSVLAHPCLRAFLSTTARASILPYFLLTTTPSSLVPSTSLVTPSTSSHPSHSLPTANALIGTMKLTTILATMPFGMVAALTASGSLVYYGNSSAQTATAINP